MWEPKYPQVPKLLHDFHVEMVTFVNKCYPIDGHKIQCADGADGRSINFAGRGGGGDSGTDRNPLDPYDTSTTAGGLVTKKISITYGTVAGLELNSYGPVTISATRYFYGMITVDSYGVPQSVVLVSSATDPDEITASDSFLVYHVYLGKAEIDDGVMTILPNLTGSQQYERCGYGDDYAHTHWGV